MTDTPSRPPDGQDPEQRLPAVIGAEAARFGSVTELIDFVTQVFV